MNSTYAVRVLLTGAGATAILDLWVLVLNRLGVKTLPMALIGRWVGHVLRGRIAHVAIRQAPAIAGERALGWAVHYATGVLFAIMLVGVAPRGWIDAPTLAPALMVGIGSVVMPLCVMQPAMGAGFFSANTPSPVLNSLRSVTNHAVLGLGFYLAAVAVSAGG